MLTSKNTVSITELRQKAALIIGKLGKSETPIFVFQRSTPKAVLVDIDAYNNLQQSYEDLLDAYELIQAQGEPTVSWKKYEKERLDKSKA